MKYLKIFELFDTEELKTKYEIPYLSGEMSPKAIGKEWQVAKHGTHKNDQLLNSLLYDNLYLFELLYKRSGRILEFGFSDVEDIKDDQVFYYFMIEIVESAKDSYILNVYAKTFVNTEQTYFETLSKRGINYDTLSSSIKNEVFDELVKYSNYLKDSFGLNKFSGKKSFNPRLN